MESTRIKAGNHPAFAVTADVSNTKQVIDYAGGHRKTDVYEAATVSTRFIVDPTQDGLAMAYWDRAP